MRSVFKPMRKLFDEYWDIIHGPTYVKSEYQKWKSIWIWSESKEDHDWGWQQKCQ